MSKPFRSRHAADLRSLFESELIIDNFAGGGGASTGIEMALAALAPGRCVDAAINHDPEAIALHAANHPGTLHYCQSVWKADPRDVVREASKRRGSVAPMPVGLAWFSPDCKHFSKAKGGKPVEKRIRDLAWVVVHWAKLVKPRIIMLENVEEFRDWGPLIETDGGKLIPCPLRKGLTFKRWVRELKKLGYAVEYRELRACDYGAPTIRKRLFLIARCDGEAIVWPKPTHSRNGAGGLLPWRTAAECIDFSLPCPSIFLTKKEAKAIGCKRPLVENTERRIGVGTIRYALAARQPFTIPVTHVGDARVHSILDPLRTQTCAHRGEHAVIVPSFAGCGGRAAQSPPRGADSPCGTQTAKPDGILVTAHLTKFRAGAVGADLSEPSPTVTANSFIKRPGGSAPIGLVTASMVQTGYGEREGQAPRVLDIQEPLGTIVADGNKHALVIGHLAQHNTGLVGHTLEKPLSTLTQGGSQQQLVTSHLIKLRGTCADGQAVDAPAPTITAGGLHLGEVRCFLVKYYGEGGQDQAVTDPMHTQTTKPRMALVSTHLVEVETTLSDELRYAAWWCARFIEKYEPQQRVAFPRIPGPRAGAVGNGDFVLVDIGQRMLTPRERYRAQGFLDSYIIDPIYEGKPLTETAQGRMCGNSVCPPMAEALVLANFGAAVPESEAA
jgi:DNA (cytosine-5)-methyltransferase 1